MPLPEFNRTDYLTYPSLCGDDTLERRIENVCLNMAYDASAAGMLPDHPDVEGHIGLLAERARDAIMRLLDDGTVRDLATERAPLRLIEALGARR